MYEEDLRERGFKEEEPGLYTAEWGEEDSTYLADNLGIEEEYETLTIQADTTTGKFTILLDDDVFDRGADIDELLEALDG